MNEPRCMWCNKRLPIDPAPDGSPPNGAVTCRACRKQTVVSNGAVMGRVVVKDKTEAK